MIEKTLRAITPLDQLEGLKKRVLDHLDDLTKPRGSLGDLERLALQYCLVRQTDKPQIRKKRIYTFAGDHGIARSGQVSAYPPEVTYQMVLNMAGEKAGAAISVLCRNNGIESFVVDMGVNHDFSETQGLLRHKIQKGTEDFSVNKAMTHDDAVKAMGVGIALAQSSHESGVDLLGFGEMGIGNTTSASALYAALLPADVENVTGYGTGIDEPIRLKKIAKIREGLIQHERDLKDPLAALSALGGFEIAGMVGMILGACSVRLPLMVDGFIASAAALVACKMNSHVQDYLFFSHVSAERGFTVLCEKLNLKPILNLGLRLGEGTGCALAMPILESSIHLYNQMATFSSAHVSDKQ